MRGVSIIARSVCSVLICVGVVITLMWPLVIVFLVLRRVAADIAALLALVLVLHLVLLVVGVAVAHLSLSCFPPLSLCSSSSSFCPWSLWPS